MAELKNELTWSFSRKRLFDSCRRRYYYRHYLMWGGWDTRASSESQAAYRLSKIQSLSQLSGSVAHRCIENALRRFRANRVVVQEKELLATARAYWNESLAQSRSGRWRQDPKRCACILEDYYKWPDYDRRAAEAWERVEISLSNFCRSRTWQQLQKSRRESWLATDSDPFRATLIHSIPVHGRPDLGYDASGAGRERSRCYIFDWKCGRARDSDVLQVRFYALYAQEEWGFKGDCVHCRIVYLFPTVEEHSVDVTEETLRESCVLLEESFAQMQSVLADVENNIPGDISLFPATDREYLCSQCQFQELCSEHGKQKPSVTPLPGDAAQVDDPFDWE